MPPKDASPTSPPSPALSEAGAKPRLLSLDAFRGLDIAAMLFVNMTWDREVFHPQFFHVEWNDPAQGATLTDLVFPWFLFIMGCAVPLSIRSGRGKGRRWPEVLLAGLRRSFVLYLLGVLLTIAGSATSSPLLWTDLLRWNILQLIALAYLVTLAVFLLPRWVGFAFVAVVLLAKWGTMTLIPWESAGTLFPPRTPVGAPIGPGTFAHFDAVKRALCLEHHDPGPVRWFVGWLGMAQQFLPCAAIAVFGGLVTQILTGPGSHPRKISRIVAIGSVTTALAFALQWGYSPSGGGLLGPFTVPFSKWFFSPAYCLLATGTGTLLFAALYALIDAAKWTSAWPLRVYGQNAIALYVGSELFFKVVASKWLLPHPEGGGRTDTLAGGFIAWTTHWSGSSAFGAWAFVLGWLLGWWLVCLWMLRKGIVIRV